MPPQRLFLASPPSVAALAAAMLEPTVIVGSYLATGAALGREVGTPDLTLCLLAFLLTFPGRNRFGVRPLDAAADIVGGWVLVLAVLGACGYAMRSIDLFDRGHVAAWAVLTPLLLWLLVLAGRQVVLAGARRNGRERLSIVVGAGTLGQKVAVALQRREPFGHGLLGHFDDRLGDRVPAGLRGQCLGNLNDVAAFVRQRGVREVYLTLPLSAQPRVVALLEQLQGTTASLYLVPDVFGVNIVQGRLQELHGIPVVGLCETPFTGVNRVVKRVLDLVLATLILLLIAPLMLLIALAIKLDSPGPVVFRQRRNGLAGEEIVVYKFRSMRTLDDGPQVRQATRGDARITRLGAFLRRTSLDELPQFFNVLQGRMSIVGPRPHAVAHNEQYRDLIRAYMVRHKVQPGITGWAQVNGCRGETDTLDKMRARIDFDLEYMRNWSVMLDLRIIVRTVALVIGDRHAY